MYNEEDKVKNIELIVLHFFYCNYCVSRIQELKESFNYGLFCPPSNGKAGKFLDEERRLGDYPFHGPVGYLEVSGFFPLIISLNTKATICNYKSFFVAAIVVVALVLK